MPHAIAQYQYLRAQQQARPIDACTDAAQYAGVPVAALAAALIAQGIDAARLSLI
jgi:pyrrolidone-carboxylate peptidase